MFFWSLMSKANVYGKKKWAGKCCIHLRIPSEGIILNYVLIDEWSFLARKAEPVKIWVTGMRRYTNGGHEIWTRVPGVLYLGEECLCAESSCWNQTTSKQTNNNKVARGLRCDQSRRNHEILERWILASSVSVRFRLIPWTWVSKVLWPWLSTLSSNKDMVQNSKEWKQTFSKIPINKQNVKKKKKTLILL